MGYHLVEHVQQEGNNHMQLQYTIINQFVIDILTCDIFIDTLSVQQMCETIHHVSKRLSVQIDKRATGQWYKSKRRKKMNAHCNGTWQTHLAA